MNPASPEPPIPPEETGLIIQRGDGLATLPHGGSPALSEMISRSLAHIQSGKALAVPERRAGEEREFEIAPGVMMRMCWIPEGEFLMGSPEDELGRFDDETQHRVTITQGFWLGKYQVTQAQWEAVMESNPSHFKGPNLPVETVSRDDISGPEGFLDKANRLVAAVGGRFSLPTEAQWEYACRASTTTALNSGKNLTSAEGVCRNLDEVAWYDKNSDEETHPGGLKKANPWGLHDMHGNLWEWCADWYAAYPTGPIADPLGPDSGSYRVVRGGGWYFTPGYCRAAFRGNGGPGGISYFLFGFRAARTSVP
jgi:formylglycine-generating enzyme required for sulfatase activity